MIMRKKREYRFEKKGKKFFKKNKYSIKAMVISALIFGIIFSMLYGIKTIYQNNFKAGVHVSFVYPEIGDGKYPDGKRFSQYDMISDEKIEEALERAAKEGFYEDYTVEDVKENVKVYNYLVNPVQSKVDNVRSSGEDFTYCSNEYILYFRQPFKMNMSIGSLFGMIRPNDAKNFVQILVEVNQDAMTVDHTGNSKAFRTLAEVEKIKKYDYEEFVDLYTLKIGQVIDYLSSKKAVSNAFKSKTTEMTFADVITSYEMLRDAELHQIASFVGSSHLTNDVNMLINKKKTMIEDNDIAFNKAWDYLSVNDYAMVTYDHTFTENLIVVAANENNGLYQARPKTAYDTVVQQRIEAETNATKYYVENEYLQKDIDNYSLVVVSEDYTRLCEKAEEMIDSFKKKYDEITEIANKTVNDYNMEDNNGYFQINPVKSGDLSSDIIKKFMLAFIIGATAGILVAFGRKSLRDKWEKKRKKAIIKSLSD